MKICNHCHIKQPNKAFCKNKNKIDGLNGNCKDCAKDFYNLKKSTILKQKRKYYVKNKKRIIERLKRYRKQNKKRIKCISKKFRLKHKEQIKQAKRKYYIKHQEKIIEKRKQYYLKQDKKLLHKKAKRHYKMNILKDKNNKLFSKYGITLDDYNEMVEAQKGVCAICGKPESVIYKKFKSIRALAVDHDHKTGKVRGLLCSKCNKMIGLANDDVNVLQLAIKYLKRKNNVSS